MTDREKYVLRAALLYGQANREHVNESFATVLSPYDDEPTLISVNGDVDAPVTEEELDRLLRTLQ